MSTLRDIEATLPPGFRFFPSDEELVCHYLYKKIANEKVLDGSHGTMVEVNLHICEPWQLPDVAKLGDNEWYFFSFRDRKYATGFRSNRTTTAGFWKATGKDRPICDSTTNSIVGMRKTLVFYFGRAPNGTKTGWIMHEFRLEHIHRPPKEEWVLCRVFYKGKTELCSKTSLENDYDDRLGTSSPPVNEFISIGSQIPQCPYHQGNNDPSAVLHTEATTPNFLELFLKECEVPVKENNSKSGEEFLFDMMLEDGVLGNEGASTFEDLRFEGDDHMLFV